MIVYKNVLASVGNLKLLELQNESYAVVINRRDIYLINKFNNLDDAVDAYENRINKQLNAKSK